MNAAITWNWTDDGEKWQSYCLQSGRWYDAKFTQEFTDKIESEFLSVFSESIGLGFEAVDVRMEAVWTKIEDEIHALLGDVEESADRCREQMRDEFDCNLKSLSQRVD